MVQKNINYKEGSLLYDAQIWVGEDLTGNDMEVMIQNLSSIYIAATDSTLERNQRARELYRRVARFVKAWSSRRRRSTFHHTSCMVGESRKALQVTSGGSTMVGYRRYMQMV
eukprot:4715042-Amphidinium_carterae.1